MVFNASRYPKISSSSLFLGVVLSNANCFNEIIGASGYGFVPGEDNTMGKISKTNS